MEIITKVQNYCLSKSDNFIIKAELVKLEGQEIKLTIKKAGKKVTNNQYRYYYKIIIGAWCEFTGYAPDQMDIILKSEYAKFQGNIDKNGFIIIPSKSKDFDTSIEESFHTYCRNKYYDLTGYLMPLPNEVFI